MSIGYNSMTFEEKEKFWREKNVDGVVNVDLYWNTTPRVLIIAHEAYLKEDDDPLKFNLIDSIKKYGKNPGGNTTLAQSAELVRRILGADSKEDVLSRVAWVNVKKQPRIGSSKEDPAEIEKALKLNQNFLFKQIEEINPDIILAYNVLYGKNSLWNPWKKERGSLLLLLKPKNEAVAKVLDESDIDVYVEEETRKIVIDTYHPTAIGEEFPIDAADKAVQCFRTGDYTLLTEWKNRRDRQ